MRGRQRLVKPEIHSDADLWEAEVDSALPLFRAFVGLWNFADREGRFEWKPKQLKALILPFWDGDFELVLSVLARCRFIVRYTHGRAAYGVIRTFQKHQSVNNRESPSELPAPPDGFDSDAYQSEVDAWGTREARVTDASGTRHGPEKAACGTRLDGIGSGSGTGSDLGTGAVGVARERAMAPVREANDETFTSGSYLQTFCDTFAAEASAMGFLPPPDPTPAQRRTGAKRAGLYARATGKPYADAALELARAALEAAKASGRSPCLLLADVQPGTSASAGNRSLAAKSGGPQRAPGTTAADFADAEPIEVQMARWNRGE